MDFQSQNTGSVRASRLRLAQVDAVTAGRGSAKEATATREVLREIAKENHASRVMGPNDARWELAREVEGSIEGGKAAIIRPEIRRRLVTTASERGLRPFDANLVIAIVQDGARRGEHLDEGVVGRLAFVGPAESDMPRRYVSLLVGATALGAAMFVALVAWLTAV